jgi:hypothetical protein
VESHDIDMPSSMPRGWTAHVKRRFFLKLRSGQYARADLEIIARGGHFFRVTSYLNPSGSRNLEYDPDAQPRDQR